MTPQHERYVLRGGKEGYDRLLILAQDRWPDTLALLQRAGAVPGMHCADIGCGGGEVSLHLAKLVSPGGRVTGFDMDGVKLDLARQEAQKRGIGNVEFHEINANDWNEVNAYDVVFSRFLLQHLSHPVDLIRRMWAGVRPGGLLIVEDADFGGLFCDPPNASFDFYARIYTETLRRHGGDPSFARSLHRRFLELGIPDAKSHIVQGARCEGPAKHLPSLTLEYISEAVLEAGLATGPELSAALADLANFENDPKTTVSSPRIFQIWSRR